MARSHDFRCYEKIFRKQEKKGNCLPRRSCLYVTGPFAGPETRGVSSPRHTAALDAITFLTRIPLHPFAQPHRSSWSPHWSQSCLLGKRTVAYHFLLILTIREICSWVLDPSASVSLFGPLSPALLWLSGAPFPLSAPFHSEPFFSYVFVLTVSVSWTGLPSHTGFNKSISLIST